MTEKEKTRKGFGLLIVLLRHAAEPGPEEVLRVFGRAIKQEQEFLERVAAETDNDDYLEAVDESASLQIEALLGASFLACQVSINAVRARCGRLHDYHKHRTGSPLLAGHKGRKDDLLQRGPGCACAMGCTAIEAIDACANYFKYHEEWTVDRQHDPPVWIPSGLQQQETIGAMQALGARPDSLLWNLRCAFQAVLGPDHFTNTEELAKLVYVWARCLIGDYKAELAKL